MISSFGRLHVKLDISGNVFSMLTVSGLSLLRLSRATQIRAKKLKRFSQE